MSVYVDDQQNPFGRMKMCHMIADLEEELHAMADAIGINRQWFQDSHYPHYDICQSKRALAIYHGAIPITAREFVKKVKELELEHD